jgi:hypothetical protein
MGQALFFLSRYQQVVLLKILSSYQVRHVIGHYAEFVFVISPGREKNFKIHVFLFCKLFDKALVENRLVGLWQCACKYALMTN